MSFLESAEEMPEEQPDCWPYHRSTLSERDLAKVNEYRRGFGLPDA